MDRRKFLLGIGSASLGGAALVGSGAFTEVRSQRSVSVQVATDENAYLGMKPLDTPNSNNYVELDGEGHLTIDVGEHDDFTSEGSAEPGEGVNSDSRTWFDGMFELCNQGKQDACLSWEFGDDFEMRDDAELYFYYEADTDGDSTTSGRVDVEPGREVPLALGECVTMGLRTETFGVDANADGALFSGEIVLTADVNGNCFGQQTQCTPECPTATNPDPGTDDFGVSIEGIDTSNFPTVGLTTRVETQAGGDGRPT